MKRVLKRGAALLMALAISLSTAQVNVYADEAMAAETQATEIVQNNWDGVTTESCYVGDNFNVTFSLSGYWDGGYNANVKIENTGDSAIENWCLDFALNNTISNMWNAVICSNEAGQYVVKNAGWNADIPVGGSAEFGLSVNENFNGFPSKYSLVGESTQAKEGDYSVEYCVDSDWGAGFSGRILITNNTDNTLEDWTLEFDFGRTITSIWNGVIESNENNHYVIKNAGYNANIAPGETVSFGFNGQDGDVNQVPENYVLNSFSQNVTEDETEPSTEPSTEPETQPETEIDTTSDIDGDRLVDYLEEYYSTDKEKADTDDDGLSDYIEIVILGTNPNSSSSDESGVLDTELDSDGDGINNGQEMKLGTNPGDDDTDADGINDEKELGLSTDPLNYDTDGDGASDGWEVQMGTDPLVADATFEVTYTSEYRDTVKPSVEIVLSGSQVDTLAVDPIVGSNLFPKEMPGYIGLAYNFSVAGEFDTATISFEFDPLQLSEDAEPTIYYFNEAEQSLEELATTVSGNVASATVEHFSTYILIDRKVYSESFTWEDTWEANSTYSNVEIVFVIDDSGSMGPIGANYDPYNTRLTVARDLIDKLPEGSKIGIVWFNDRVELLTPELTINKSQAKSYLTTTYFKSYGGTYMYTAINDGFSLFQSYEGDILRMMVVLSDGITDDITKHTFTITNANNNNVRIYSVGLGSSVSYFNTYLKPLAEQTGGSFYLAANAGQLAGIYEDINKKIDLSTDSDTDGIPDYYEDNMVAFNGMSIELDKNDDDSDDDGLLDGQEVEVKLEYNKDKTKACVKGKYISLPDNPDSDNDGIDDKNDPERMEYTITDRTIAMVEGLSYSNLASYIGQTLGDAIANGAVIENISDEHVKYLEDAIIVHANDSGKGYWKDFWDSGLGIVALKFVRSTQPTSVIFALRGTEPDSDLANDAATDLVLGVGWDSVQSRNAFKAYKKVATNKSYDYYVTGHSLGGRLAQDVIYKTYNANEGGLFKKKADIPTPVHSATFNALGYNRIVYMTLENDLLKSYKSKLVNFYYWLDLVGEGLGVSVPYKHAGTDVELLCRDINGNYLRDKEFDNMFNVRDVKYHGITYFHDDYDLLYTSPHSFSYWAK